jgi:large repetitive protein
MRGFATRTVLLATALITLGLVLNAGQAMATHVSCGDTITQDTTLDSDLINCPTNGLIIGADGVTLDLNGHTIDASPDCCHEGIVNTAPYGASGYSDITIENGTVRDFTVPIHLSLASHIRIMRTSLIAGKDRGIVLDGTRDTRVEDNVVKGIALVPFLRGPDAVAQSDNNLIKHNSISDGRIYINGSNNRIVNNTVFGEYFAGIDIFRSANKVYGNEVSISGELWAVSLLSASDTRVVGNSISSDQGDGLLLSAATDNLITGNSVFANRHDGIVLEENSNRNDLVKNTALRNGGVGIHIDGRFGYFAGSGNRVKKNTAEQNARDGINVDALSSETVIQGNVADQNFDDGIDVESEVARLVANRANNNGDLGIEAVTGVTDGGGNRAFGNGNPLQCLNVACK